MYQNIQALRFFAAFGVLLFHVFSIYNHYNGALLRPLAVIFDPLGKVGVDVFFVISGFVIWTSTEFKHDRSDALPFLVRRYTRIFISYWPMLLFAAAVDVMIRDRNLLDSNILGSITLLPPEFGTGGKLILPVGWTLTFELIFYTVFGVLMLLSSRKATLAAMALWGVFVLTPFAPAHTFFSPLIAQFAAGCLLAAALPKVDVKRIPISWACLIAAMFLVFGAHGDGAWARAVWFGSFAVAIVVVAVCLEARGFMASERLVYWGGASYALYLCHFPILQAVAHQWQLVKLYPEAMLLPVIPLSLAVAYLWWHFVEQRMIRLTRHFADRLFPRLRGVIRPLHAPPPA